MRGRIVAVSMLGAAGTIQLLPELPSLKVYACVALVLCLISAFFWYVGRRWPGTREASLTFGLALWAFAVMGFYVAQRAEMRLNDMLDPGNENLVSRVELRVASLPRIKARSRQFEATVLSSRPGGVPSRILVTWAAKGYVGPYASEQDQPADFPRIIPGQVWKMALILKTPHGARNPHGFDYEAYVFADGLRATGRVRGEPKYLRDEGWAGISGSAQRARYYVRQALNPYLEGKRYGAVLLALTIGDQASVTADDWLVFNRSGITHLVSISGSHITMIAAVGGLLVFSLWRRLSWRGRGLAERIPARLAAAVVALIIAWLYCLLAGWGVPARRTFLMLSVIGAAQFMRLPLSVSRLLSVVAVIVVVLDPWALLASGFWLSFGAVYILLASARWWGQQILDTGVSKRTMWVRAALMVTSLQLAITVGLMPILALIFHDVSVVSPFVNAYAIPVISFVVTPLALLAAFFALLPGFEFWTSTLAWVGHTAFDLMMQPTQWLAALPWSSFTVAAAPLGITVMAFSGIAVAVCPYGLPLRSLGWLLILPALTWSSPRPPHGSWDLHALDVGQGSAIVIRTATHTLLFDTGLRYSAESDEGMRSVTPFLRTLGERRLDVLVVSHADIDHAGGVRSVIEAFPVEQSFTSFPVKAYLKREGGRLKRSLAEGALPLAMSNCGYGTRWQADGVTFSFLWPLRQALQAAGSNPGSKARNAASCVLRVQGHHHAALLPGDIGKNQEAQLVDRGLLGADVVVAPHHGSGKSSSQAFIKAVRAQHIVIQAGLWNRYNHPAVSTLMHWQNAGVRLWRTDRDGAVSVQSRPEQIFVTVERIRKKRYWQHFVPD